MDRRIRKNQTAIMSALIQLMTEKDFDKITINEIAERADVNRGTIYSHYADKYDLMNKCLESQLEQLIDNCSEIPDKSEPNSSKMSLLRTLELLEENAHFYKTILRNTALLSFRNQLQEMLNKQVKVQLFTSSLTLDELSVEISAQFLSSATVGVIEWWLTHSNPCSAQEINEKLWSMLDLNMQMIQSTP